jgi:hypothetical protein
LIQHQQKAGQIAALYKAVLGCSFAPISILLICPALRHGKPIHLDHIFAQFKVKLDKWDGSNLAKLVKLGGL